MTSRILCAAALATMLGAGVVACHVHYGDPDGDDDGDDDGGTADASLVNDGPTASLDGAPSFFPDAPGVGADAADFPDGGGFLTPDAWDVGPDAASSSADAAVIPLDGFVP